MSSKKTKHAKLDALKNNKDYFFIGDLRHKTYHRKDSECVDLHITKNDMIGLGRNPSTKGFKPCTFCHPEDITLPLLPKPAKPQKRKSELTQEELTKVAEQYGLHVEFIGSNIYVTTIAGEWYFDYNIRPIVLRHKNNYPYTNKNGRPKKHYHEQPNTFPNPLEALKYIFRHERAAIRRGFDDEENDVGPVLLTLQEAIELSQKQTITAALDAAGSNLQMTAEILGVSISTLYRKRKKLGLLEADK